MTSEKLNTSPLHLTKKYQPTRVDPRMLENCRDNAATIGIVGHSVGPAVFQKEGFTD